MASQNQDRQDGQVAREPGVAARSPQSHESGRALRLAALVAVAIGLAALTAGACLLSYDHIQHLALQSGVSTKLANVYPLILDALLVLAGCSVLALRGAGIGSRIYAWLCMLVLLAGLAAGGAVHAAGVRFSRKGAGIAAAVLPWLLVLVGFGLLLALLRYARQRRQANRTSITEHPAQPLPDDIPDVVRTGPRTSPAATRPPTAPAPAGPGSAAGSAASTGPAGPGPAGQTSAARAPAGPVPVPRPAPDLAPMPRSGQVPTSAQAPPSAHTPPPAQAPTSAQAPPAAQVPPAAPAAASAQASSAAEQPTGSPATQATPAPAGTSATEPADVPVQNPALAALAMTRSHTEPATAPQPAITNLTKPGHFKLPVRQADLQLRARTPRPAPAAGGPPSPESGAVRAGSGQDRPLMPRVGAQPTQAPEQPGRQPTTQPAPDAEAPGPAEPTGGPQPAGGPQSPDPTQPAAATGTERGSADDLSAAPTADADDDAEEAMPRGLPGFLRQRSSPTPPDEE